MARKRGKLIALAVVAAAVGLYAYREVAEGRHRARLQGSLERGFAALDEGRHERAVAAFDEAIALDPNSARARFGRGVAQRRRHIYNEAIADCAAAARLDPQNAEAFNCVGAVQQVVGRPREAETALRAATALDPSLLEARVTLARLLLREDRPEEALAELRDALDDIGDDAYLRYYEGDALVALGRLGEAQEALARCVQLSPNGPLPWFKLAQARRMAGDAGGAEAALRRYAELSREHPIRGGLADIVPAAGEDP